MHITSKVALEVAIALGASFLAYAVFRPKSLAEKMQVGDVATVDMTKIAIDISDPIVQSEQAKDPTTVAGMSRVIAALQSPGSQATLGVPVRDLPVLSLPNASGLIKSRLPVPGGLDYPVTFPVGAIILLKRNGSPV